MEKSEVEKRVAAVVARILEVPEDSIAEGTNLVSDLSAESLDLVDLVVALEEEFGVEVPDEDISSIQTVGDIVEFVMKNANA